MATLLRRNVWVGIATLVCVMAIFLVGAPGQAQADTRLSYSGYAGPSSLSEPAAACVHTYRTIGAGTSSGSVNVWARAGYNNGQRVSYQFRLFEANYYNNYSYVNIGTSAMKYGTAYPNRKASLAGTAHTWYKQYTGYHYVYHKVLVDIYWYNSSGRVSGTTTREVDWYVQDGVQIQDSCFYY